jgi:hypothetical protein
MKYREYLEDKKYALMDFKGNYFYLKYLTINFEVYKKNLPIIIGDDEKEWRNISDKFATDVIQNNLRVYLNVIKRKEELFNKFENFNHDLIQIRNGNIVEFSDPLLAVHDWIKSNLLLPAMGFEVFNSIDSKNTELKKEMHVMEQVQFGIMDAWFRRELEWEMDEIKQNIGKLYNVDDDIILMPSDDYFNTKVNRMLKESINEFNKNVEKAEETVPTKNDNFDSKNTDIPDAIAELENDLTEKKKELALSEKELLDSVLKLQSKGNSIALFKGQNLKWEHIIFTIPAESYTSSFEFRVRIKSSQKTYSFSLKEFGFWNNRDKVTNRHFNTLMALATIQANIGKKPHSKGLRKFGKNVSALGKILNNQLGVDGSPFQDINLFWTPKFKIVIDKIDESVYHDPRTSTYNDGIELKE